MVPFILQTEVKKAQPREVMQSLQGGRGRAGRALAGRGFCKYRTSLLFGHITNISCNLLETVNV